VPAAGPTVLQGLPDHALLVVDRSAPGLRLRAIECDPAIISLPGATLAQLAPPSCAGAPQRLSPHVSPPRDPFDPATPPATPPRPPAPIPGQYAAAYRLRHAERLQQPASPGDKADVTRRARPPLHALLLPHPQVRQHRRPDAPCRQPQRHPPA
jgi:hypothetical protein